MSTCIWWVWPAGSPHKRVHIAPCTHRTSFHLDLMRRQASQCGGLHGKDSARFRCLMVMAYLFEWLHLVVVISKSSLERVPIAPCTDGKTFHLDLVSSKASQCGGLDGKDSARFRCLMVTGHPFECLYLVATASRPPAGKKCHHAAHPRQAFPSRPHSQACIIV